MLQVYAHKETCSEEVKVEKMVTRNLLEFVPPISGELGNEPRSTNATKLELIWGGTMYHIDDLPFDCESLPDVYTQFRKVLLFFTICFCFRKLAIQDTFSYLIC